MCPNMGVSGSEKQACRVEDGTKEPAFGKGGQYSFFFNMERSLRGE